MTRCFLSESNLKDNFWVRAADTLCQQLEPKRCLSDLILRDLILAACYIRNRCSTKGNDSDETPYEMFFDKKHTVYHLRRFGCLAYTKTMSNSQYT